MHTGLMHPLPLGYKTFGGCHFWNMQLKKPLLPFQFIGSVEFQLHDLLQKHSSRVEDKLDYFTPSLTVCLGEGWG